MYNKLCNKQDEIFYSRMSYLHKDKDHQMIFKKIQII
jgi:hypothetical protein